MTTCGFSLGAFAPVTVSSSGIVFASAGFDAFAVRTVTLWVVPDAVPHGEGVAAGDRGVVLPGLRRAALGGVRDGDRLLGGDGAGGGDGERQLSGGAVLHRAYGRVGDHARGEGRVRLAVQLDRVQGEFAGSAAGQGEGVAPHLVQAEDLVDAADGLVVGAVDEVRERDLDEVPALPVVGEGGGPQLGRAAVRAAVLDLEVDLLAGAGRQRRGVLAVPPEADALVGGPVLRRGVHGELMAEPAVRADVVGAFEDVSALGGVGALGQLQLRVVVRVAAPGEEGVGGRLTSEGYLALEAVDEDGGRFVGRRDGGSGGRAA